MILGITPAALLRHLAFGLGVALLAALIVRLMISVRVMDRPEARKAHVRPTPKGGGVGIVVSFLLGIAVLYRFAAFALLFELIKELVIRHDDMGVTADL